MVILSFSSFPAPGPVWQLLTLNRDSNTNERGASVLIERENEEKDGNKQEMRRGGRARGPSGTEGVLINTEEARCESDAKRTGKKGGTSVEAPAPQRLAYRIPRALPREYLGFLLACGLVCLVKQGQKEGASVAASNGGVGTPPGRGYEAGRAQIGQPDVPRRDAPQVAVSLTSSKWAGDGEIWTLGCWRWGAAG
ncbi:hypothetical protein CCMA1212_009371 [Trichoderma ghanense]|uniref:Uncharacterized protein n=1 Tax=Trichoderma ghanense TaxID=65468 RepID=A0ABY2GTN6_9HYPO